MRGRRRYRYIALGCSLAAVSCLGLWYWYHAQDYRLRSTSQSVEQGTWIGYTESDLLQRLGTPTAVRARYVEIGSETPPAMPPGPYRTLVYKGKTGVLYVWMHRRGKGYQCFDSLWFDEGVQF